MGDGVSAIVEEEGGKASGGLDGVVVCIGHEGKMLIPVPQILADVLAQELSDAANGPFSLATGLGVEGRRPEACA